MRRQTLFVLVFLAVPLFAQTPPVIEKIDVSVVNVDVTVTDHAGNPVRRTRHRFRFAQSTASAASNVWVAPRDVHSSGWGAADSGDSGDVVDSEK